jgi:TrmH family RNA methyltransferase
MSVAAVMLVESSLAGNLGAAIRVAANFGVPRLDLVRPAVDPESPEVVRWACGGHAQLEIKTWSSFEDAASRYRSLLGAASVRGRDNQPFVTPREALRAVESRGLDSTALVFGNETSGLSREDLDRCDLTVRIPTVPDFPVLNLVQAIAVLLAYFRLEADPEPPASPTPAEQSLVTGLMVHLESALSAIGFLDPSNPRRVLRKLRRLFGRAGITENEVAILRGICRQMEWAARRDASREPEP